jgi:hypothetical protein
VSTFPFAGYYAAERNAVVALMLLGITSVAAAAWAVRARGPLTAMAWPLAIGALVQLGVGAGTAFNAHRGLAQQLMVNSQTIVALTAKLKGQSKNYRDATRVELGLVAVAAVLSLKFSRPSTARAVLLGILVEGVAILCFDTFGLRRTTQRLDQLRASSAESTPAE